MAERRMFAKTIIDSDAFLDMSLSTQALYFHLSMRADDEGFINNPKKIARMIGSNDDDFKILIAKKFIIGFESGVIVIKHWKIHNYIQKDRFKETNYHEEKALLAVEKNNGYTLDTECIQNGSTGKVRLELGKDRKEDIIYPFSEIVSFLNLKANTKYRSNSKKTQDLIKARFNEDFNLQDFQLVIEKKCLEWLNTDMEKYLTPTTLFSNKFENYLNQKVNKPHQSKISPQNSTNDLISKIYGNSNHNDDDIIDIESF